MTAGATPDWIAIRLALVSVADKRGLLALAQGLAALGVTIGATDGTFSTLYVDGLETELVSRYVQPLFGGRVKTLYPEMLAPIMARTGELEELAAAGLEPIDLVVCNPSPFASTAARPDVTLAMASDAIDGGGIALIRAAAASCARVAVVVDPDDYPMILTELAWTGGLSAATRRWLAAKAFAVTAAHDAAVASWLADVPDLAAREPDARVSRPRLGAMVTGPWARGWAAVAPDEDGVTRAALYADLGAGAPWLAAGPGTLWLAGGGGWRPLTAAVLRDVDRALAVARELPGPAAVIVRDDDPVAVSDVEHPAAAIGRVLAFADDAEATTGGVLALAAPLTEPLTHQLARSGLAAIVVPWVGYDVLWAWPFDGPAVLVALGWWHVGAAAWAPMPPLRWRSVAGGLLVQEGDVTPIDVWAGGAVTARAPTDPEATDLRLAARVARHVRACGLVLAAGGGTVAIVGGQPDLRRALLVARGVENDVLHDSVAAVSAAIDDPLAIDALADAGIRAVVQPGGSVEDQAVVAAADRRGLAMVMTGLERVRR